MSDQTSDKFRYYRITSTQEFPEGERLFVEINNLSIVIFSLNGEYYATSDECSHDGGPIGDGQIEGYEIICPRHGARFDLRTGKVTHFPAVTDIASYPIRIVDGNIEVGLPLQ
jgi:3-phenylpropionate/trans-cinnamate dioxygenase ferredoxin component